MNTYVYFWFRWKNPKNEFDFVMKTDKTRRTDKLAETCMEKALKYLGLEHLQPTKHEIELLKESMRFGRLEGENKNNYFLYDGGGIPDSVILEG